MSQKSIPGACPNCKKETLTIAVQFRDHKDWQLKYGIECAICGYRFTVDKKSMDDMFTLWKDKK